MARRLLAVLGALGAITLLGSCAHTPGVSQRAAAVAPGAAPATVDGRAGGPAGARVAAPDDERADARARAQAVVDALVARGAPGASAALLLPGGVQLLVTAGARSLDGDEPLRAGDRMLGGSTGKLWVSAVAHRLAAAGRLDLDARAASFFADARPAPAWLARVPNAGAVTLRQLLRHTTGIPRYVFDEAFAATLVAQADRVWRPAELLAYVYDVEPLFAPGEGWAYADTNYLVVGLVLERVTGRAFYDLADALVVRPLGLTGSVPSDSRRVPGLVQGHVVMGRGMGVPERALRDGVSTYNLQFEWCGGGWATTPRDLAVLVRALYGGELFDDATLAGLLEAVDAPGLGPGVRYGSGVMRRDTALGELRYHDGFMPGYLTSTGWFPELGVAVALQLNTDDGRVIGRPPADVLVELAGAVAGR